MLGAIRDLMQPPAGMAMDFSAPAGEPALAPVGGVSWRVFANPVPLFIGGVAAVLLELAEPSVRSGVWDHSSFRRDPATRLRRTGFAAMMTVYGPRSAAERMIAQVVRMHDRVEGVTAAGLRYRANDPHLLDWVQATAVFGFTEAYHLYAVPLSQAEKSAAFAEGQAAARLYGAADAPRSWEAWERLLAQTAPRLEGSAVLTEFLDIMSEAAILPSPLRGLQRLFVHAAVEMTPEPVRSFPQLRGRGLRAAEGQVVRLLGALAGKVPLNDLPAAQAARRMRVAY
jgi:uncharacterized protein (DUF2236 family)